MTNILFPSSVILYIQLAKKLQEQSEKNDRELLDERNKNIKSIVKFVTSEKKSAKKKSKKNEEIVADANVPCSEYLKMVKGKRNRNKRKLQDLGLMQKTPTPKKDDQSTSSKKTPQSKTKGKNVRRKIMQSPADADSKSPAEEKMKCPFNHQDFNTNYNEEHDRRYVGSGYDLHNVNCQKCKKKFSKEFADNCITPNIKLPMYVCQGRQKYHCSHCYCYECYQDSFMKDSAKRTSRRKK